MIKLSGALIILAAATLCGFYRADRLRCRSAFFNDFLCFLAVFKARLRYECSDIKTLIPLCSDFPSLLPLREEFLNADSSPVKVIWDRGILKCRALSALTNEDINVLCEFGASLGSTDMQGQLEHICLYETLAQKLLNNAQRDLSQKGRLYKMLGFFAGSVIAIAIL